MKHTKADERRVAKWIRNWRETLHLQDWDITLKFEDEEKYLSNGAESAADTQRDFYYLQATIGIYKGFWTENLEDQWRHVVHECIHIFMADYDHLIYEAQRGRAIFDAIIDKTRENTTVRITSLLTSAWPWKKGL